MSKYDKDYEDYLEEEYLNHKIDRDNDNEDIEEIINKYFNKELIKEYTNNDNQEYLDFLFQKIINEDNENNTSKIEQKKDFLDLLKKTYFQKQSSTKDKINYLILYLKNKYSIITGKILYSLFNTDKNKDENNMSESDYKNFILMNFNKETIDLNNEKEKQNFINLLLEIID